MQTPRIIHFPETKLIGMSVRSKADDMMTPGLWKSFMPRRKEISNRCSNATYSVQLFDELPDKRFSNIPEFTKWGAVEVSTFDTIPEGMKSLIIEQGEYAVFEHSGVSSTFGNTLQYIFGIWLPGSAYQLDHRPHFALMDERYLGPNNPASLEEIYVPIRKSS